MANINANQIFCTIYHGFIIMCLDLLCNYWLEISFTELRRKYFNFILNWFIPSLDEVNMPYDKEQIIIILMKWKIG